MVMDAKTADLARKLEKYPHIRARLEALFNIAENTSGEFDVADDAEAQLVVDIRKMGHEMLQTWANNQVVKKTDDTRKRKEATSQTKKNYAGTQRLEK
jgi:hypothetical protein